MSQADCLSFLLASTTHDLSGSHSIHLLSRLCRSGFREGWTGLRSGSRGLKPGAGRKVFTQRFWETKTFQAYSDHWQNPVPCGRKSEDPGILLAVT